MRAPSFGWASGPVAVTAVFLVVLAAPLAGAISVSFGVSPPYGAYGAVPDRGHSVALASGAGFNQIRVAPTFNVSWGVARLAERSDSSGGGSYSLVVWAGMQNFSFTCGSGCGTGKHGVWIEWNRTWSTLLNSSCPASSTGSWLHASVYVNLSSEILDTSVSPPAVVAQKLSTVYGHQIFGPSVVRGHRSGSLGLQHFRAPLVYGSNYALVALVVTTTYAASSVGGACSSGAQATVGSSTPPIYGNQMMLEHIFIS